MHEKLHAIFAECDSPTHCTRGHVLAATKPLGAFAANFQRQTTELRALLMEAESEATLPDAFRGKLEFLHQTLAARDRVGAELLRVVRDATSIQVQTDTVFAGARADLER